MSNPPTQDQLRTIVQGDVLSGGFPKRSETFFFFNIANPLDFTKKLATVAPATSTTAAPALFDSYASVTKIRSNINAFNAANKGKGLTFPSVAANIAFSFLGLQALDDAKVLKGALKTTSIPDSDALFAQGMAKDTTLLDPPMDAYKKANFKPNSSTVIHGVILVAGSGTDTVSDRLTKIKSAFGTSITEVISEVGVARFGDNGQFKGKEHFGFEDGVSQPTLKGIGADDPDGKIVDGTVSGDSGWNTIDQNRILLQDKGPGGHPDWMQNGSFLVFRKLQQDVKAWNDFVVNNTAPGTDAAKLGLDPFSLGAKMMGRYKSGCPVMLNATGKDVSNDDLLAKRNDFNFFTGELGDANKTVVNNSGDFICPVGAHIRKTNPRDGNNLGRIMRRGIAYGTDFKQGVTTDKNRGLLFACYQSNIGAGFQFVQSQWANNDTFPGSGAGIDQMLGQTAQDKAATATTDPKFTVPTMEISSIVSPTFKGTVSLPATAKTGLAQFVTTIWGEYFFTPPYTALSGALAGK